MISLLFFENIINSTLKIQFNFHIQQKFFICDDKTLLYWAKNKYGLGRNGPRNNSFKSKGNAGSYQ